MHNVIPAYDYSQSWLFWIFLANVIIIPGLVILFDDGKIHDSAKK